MLCELRQCCPNEKIVITSEARGLLSSDPQGQQIPRVRLVMAISWFGRLLLFLASASIEHGSKVRVSERYTSFRSSRRRILPEAVRGSVGTKWISRGVL